jgi:hypothetical protein
MAHDAVIAGAGATGLGMAINSSRRGGATSSCWSAATTSAARVVGEHLPWVPPGRSVASVFVLVRAQPVLDAQRTALQGDPRLPALLRGPLRARRCASGATTSAAEDAAGSSRAPRAAPRPAGWILAAGSAVGAAGAERAGIEDFAGATCIRRSGTTTSTSPASAWRSSAPAPRRSSSCPRSARWPARCTCSAHPAGGSSRSRTADQPGGAPALRPRPARPAVRARRSLPGTRGAFGHVHAPAGDALGPLPARRISAQAPGAGSGAAGAGCAWNYRMGCAHLAVEQLVSTRRWPTSSSLPTGSPRCARSHRHPRRARARDRHADLRHRVPLPATCRWPT